MKWILCYLLPITCIFANANQEELNSFQDAIKSLISEILEACEDDQSPFSISSHEIELASGPLAYTSIAGTLPQFTENGESIGEIFFTAYLKEDENSDRPVTFIFNGGPGGSSLAMHIGGFGPRRIAFLEEGQSSLPPYQMIDNTETLLETSDLVFIDPIGTGYSHAVQDNHKKFYYSVEGDLSSFAEFIRVFCVHFDRWNSPKYLIGASYGTCRACGLSELLADRGIYLNGVALLSCAIDMSTIFGQRDQALSECLRIPTLAATAWYHGRAMQDKTLEEVVEYAKRFSYEQYAPAMLQPSRLSPAEQREFYQDLANLIGLPIDTIRRYQARIDERRFVTEFLAPERKLIGGCDSRYIGDVSAIAGEYLEDPSYREIRPTLYASFLNYLQTDLDVKIQSKRYEDFSNEAFFNWNWNMYDIDGMPNFLQRLRRTLIANPYMKVFIGSGYYDIRTPFAAAEYSLDHLELPHHFQENFQVEYYEAGHGYIFDLPSLKKLKNDLEHFYRFEKPANPSTSGCIRRK